MNQAVGGGFGLLLACLIVQADDRPRDKPPTPRAQYDALVKEDKEQDKVYAKAWGEAKTPEDQQKLGSEAWKKTEKLFVRFIALAEKNPKDPVAVDALLFVVWRNPAWRGWPSPGPSRK